MKGVLRMCSLTIGLMAAQTGLQMYQNNQQAKMQEAQYKMQAKQAEFNRAAEQHKAEKMVESYAQKQHALNDKFKLATGNARAQFGASGLDSQGGSLSDVIGASTDAYNRDSQNLLSNQREDSWASYVSQVNQLNEMNAYNTMAKNTKRQLAFNQFGTILSGVSSIYGQGYKEGLWGGGSGSKSSGAIFSGNTLNSSTNGYNFNNAYRKSANYGMGGIMP